MENLKKLGENKIKLRTIYPKIRENSNNKVWDPTLLVLIKKRVYYYPHYYKRLFLKFTNISV